MPMRFGCFDKCKTKRELLRKRERMTARSPNMITKITGDLLKNRRKKEKKRFLFFLWDSLISFTVSVKYIKRKYSTILINHWDLNKRQMNPAVWVPELLQWPLPSAAVLHTANEAGTRGFQLTSPLTAIVGFFALLLKNNNTSQQLPGVIYLNSTGDNYKWISSYGVFPAICFSFLLVQLIPNILRTIFLILHYPFNFDQNEIQNNSI